jgi:rhodanese-related sulfurtransferase
MKKILLSDYKEDMGIFIEINNTYNNVVKNSVHIPYDNLLVNYKELLDKSKKYYIYCKSGMKSKKAVNILGFYGYDVTLVY